ncbi:response regulator transcription factor [Pseudohalioglobus lutimaris]|uniref:DNA-binding response regulator n=1 Tax=Pseudohalioglobus lutimaris TaxID=1737061 RepID=A0A2N5X532_9GAMM|nr:response regulator transcription factor [Pseudohalioglobus lutimaris]PLW69595.1 DNA-binding response regulator [Pseudohalioglobus lutimaris]
MRLLLLEDDPDTAEYVLQGFREDGHIIDHASRGEDVIMLAAESDYDALILDRMVPGFDGFRVLSMLRAGGDTTPAIFLTAVSNLNDRVEGLKMADDYLVKPFAFAELRARVEAITRRPQLRQTPDSLSVGDLEINLLKRTVRRANQEIAVLPTEFRLLEYLMKNKGNVVTRTMLLEHVWEFNFDPKTNIVETHISRLRAKVDRGFDKELIKTIRGAGYMITNGD